MNKILFTLFLGIRRAVYVSLHFVDQTLLRRSNRLFIVSYHSVAKDNERFSINPSVMKKQLSYLKKNYEFLKLSEAEAVLQGKKELTRPSVVITIDDGYKDILTMKPYFAKLGIKPALFVLTNTKQANRQELANKREFLSKTDIKALKKAGWEIGSHSATHANLATLSAKELTEEIIISKKELETLLGTTVSYFAYPRGKYSQAVLAAVKKAKYTLGLTMDDGVALNTKNLLLLPRVGVDRSHSFAEFKAAFSPSVVSGRKLIKESYFGRFI
jgi:peptidoglycan/xylan/chitin deacetylase (PgdA/CDA1 family)